uniref:Ovule protein n=1 Tax=Hydatigena taeniaeformis TaxID=6205 RepID=A0A0R3XDL1_HYDTA
LCLPPPPPPPPRMRFSVSAHTSPPSLQVSPLCLTPIYSSTFFNEIPHCSSTSLHTSSSSQLHHQFSSECTPRGSTVDAT